MHENFSSFEYKLYGRQMILPELGMQGQQKLKGSHAVVIGAGGLGAPSLLYLAGAGVGRITVIDDDRLELSNLHRQVIHTYSRVGNSKAESAADSLRSLNPFIEVRAVQQRLTRKNAEELFAGAHVVLDGSDNFETRYIASEACASLGIPHVWAAILGFDAQMSVFWSGRGPVYEDLYPVQPPAGSVPSCSTAGVMGALAGVVGTSMAMEALKLLAGIGEPLMGQVGYYSGLEGRWEYIPLLGNSAEISSVSQRQGAGDSAVKKPNLINRHNSALSSVEAQGKGSVDISWSQFKEISPWEQKILVDVREPAEFHALSVPGAINLPYAALQKLSEQGALAQYFREKIGGAQAPVGVYCSGGPRSESAAQILRDAGVEQAYNLSGGLAEWLTRKI